MAEIRPYTQLCNVLPAIINLRRQWSFRRPRRHKGVGRPPSRVQAKRRMAYLNNNGLLLMSTRDGR